MAQPTPPDTASPPAPADGDRPPPWPALVAAIETLRRAVGPAAGPPPGRQLAAIAAAFAALAGCYLRAIVATGRTSMRAEAAARALDLRTPKSALLRFLGRPDGPPR